MVRKPYDSKQGGDIPDKGTGDNKMNLEHAPIGELHRQAEQLNIPDYKSLNKQQLIEELHRRGV